VCLISPVLNSDNICEVKLLRESMSRVSVGGWLCRYPLSIVSLNSVLPEKKHVFNISYIDITKKISYLEPFFSGNDGNLPEIQGPQN
jgi:hypothetical protein